MKPAAIIGIVLIIGGVAGLFLGNIHWTETKNVVDAGPIQVNTQEHHSVWIPTLAAIAAVVAGSVLVFVSRNSD